VIDIAEAEGDVNLFSLIVNAPFWTIPLYIFPLYIALSSVPCGNVTPLETHGSFFIEFEELSSGFGPRPKSWRRTLFGVTSSERPQLIFLNIFSF